MYIHFIWYDRFQTAEEVRLFTIPYVPKDKSVAPLLRLLF